MGFKLGRVLKKGVKSVLKRAPAVVGGFLTGGPMGAGLAFASSAASKFTGGSVGGAVPSIQALTGVPSFLPVRLDPEVQTEGVPMPTAGALPAIISGMNRITAMAIARLAAALGIPFTLASIGRVGLRLWRSMMAFARRHPGVSIIGVLTGLGLAADEAAHFLSWGATRARRRRGRGISARDIRICRRTIRKMSAFRRDLGSLGPPARRGAAHHHHPRGGVV